MVSPEPLLGRYHFVKRLKGSAKLVAWLAEKSTGQRVIVSVLSDARADGLRPIIGMSDPRLAEMLAVVDSAQASELPDDCPLPAGARLVVAEYIAGRSLARRVETGRIDPLRAVRWFAQLADAVSRVHERAAVHGAISPRAVVVSRVTRGPVPILTHLLAPPSGAYCSPERVAGSGPTAADDVWALCATFYTALTQRPPFQGGSREQLAHAILRADIEPPTSVNTDLQELVMRGLDRNASYRFSDGSALCDALEHWLSLNEPQSSPVTQPTEESTVSELSGAFDLGDSSTGTQPSADVATDASVVAAARSVPSAELAGARQTDAPTSASDPDDRLTTPGKLQMPQPKQQSRVRVGLAMLIAIFTGAAGYGLWRMMLEARAPAREQASSNAIERAPDSFAPAGNTAREHSASRTRDGHDTGGVDGGLKSVHALTASVEKTAPEAPAECMERLLPAGTLGSSPDLDYLCESTELWAIGRKLHSHIARHGKGPGLELWVYLGRYDIPAVAVLRNTCCPGAPPITAATPHTPCGSLTTVVRALGKNPSPENRDQYRETVACLIAREVRLPELWDRIGERRGRQAFDEFLNVVRQANSR